LKLLSAEARVHHRAVLKLAWPITVSMLSYTAMAIFDTIVVGRLGTTALAAMGPGVTVSFVVLAFGNGLLRSIKVVAAQRTGAGDLDAASRLAWQAMWLVLALTVPALLVIPATPWVLSWLGASPGAAADASAYLAVRLMGAPFLYGTIAFGAFLQGRGDTRSPMIATLLSNVVNVVLDPILVFGLAGAPQLGIAGAGLAAVLSWVVGLTWLLQCVRPILAATPARPDLGVMGDVWRIGSPMGVQMLADVASFGIFAGFIARVGDADLAAHVITIRIMCISFLPGYAIGEAASVLVGQAVGAGRLDDARAAWRSASFIAVAVMMGWGVVFVGLPGPLIAMFAPSPDVVAVARQLLLIAAAVQLFDGLATVAYSALAGAGDTRFTMLWNGVICWFVKLPLAWCLAIPLGLGATGAWLGLSAEIVALAAVGVWRIYSGAWLRAVRPQTASAVELAA
jgi:MATE family multidrug resistance protein